MFVIAAFAATSAAAQFNPQQLRFRRTRTSARASFRKRNDLLHPPQRKKPKATGRLYILHDVGAIQENDSQQGLAHFLEHMAFNGTKNLPGKMLTEYLGKVGVKFGANLNAGTGRGPDDLHDEGRPFARRH